MIDKQRRTLPLIYEIKKLRRRSVPPRIAEAPLLQRSRDAKPLRLFQTISSLISAKLHYALLLQLSLFGRL
jgi:hypothetical protein